MSNQDTPTPEKPQFAPPGHRWVSQLEFEAESEIDLAIRSIEGVAAILINCLSGDLFESECDRRALEFVTEGLYRSIDALRVNFDSSKRVAAKGVRA